MLNKKIKESLIRNTWVEINLDNIVYNLSRARKMIDPETKIAGVVKANAYGHGALRVAKTLIENNIDMLAVACLSEGIELRRRYPEIPIFIMGYTPNNTLKFAVETNMIITIFSLEQAEILSDIGLSLKKDVAVHIKINTGMNRIGFNVSSNTIDTIIKIYNLKNIYVQGIFTHLALKSYETDKQQIDLFMDLMYNIETKGIRIPVKHICDSIGMVMYPQYHLDMIRLGSFMYGVKPLMIKDETETLKLAMTFKTQISQIKEIQKGEGVGYDYFFVAKDNTIVGTLPVGYGDGYMRCLTGKGEVSIKGKKIPIIGKICMDQCMVDLTNVSEVNVGDEVVLLGEDSKDVVTLSEVTEKANANNNEILSTISRRVPRVYIENNDVVEMIDYLLD